MLVHKAKHGVKWTSEEDDELQRRCEAGEYLEDIAKALQRTGESVRTRANHLGVPCRSGRSRNAKRA
jgi:hypothetical protein